MSRIFSLLPSAHPPSHSHSFLTLLLTLLFISLLPMNTELALCIHICYTPFLIEILPIFNLMIFSTLIKQINTILVVIIIEYDYYS